jgi:hypothetical protein
MRPRLAALAIAILSVIAAPLVRAQPADIRRALDLAEARYQQASREAQQAQQGYDEAVARNKDIAANYHGALNEQKTAGRLLADADVSGPRAAEAVKGEEANVEAERQKIAPQQAKLDAANADFQRQLDRALADVPEWRQASDRVAAARAKHDAVGHDRLAALADDDEAYLALLMDSWDAEDEVRALVFGPNTAPSAVAEATQAWMASLDAVDRYEAHALASDANVRAAADALAQETANQNALRDRLAQQVAPANPDLQRAAEALTAERNAFNIASGNLQHAQAARDAARAEQARIESVVTDARQRLARVEHDLPLIQADQARSEADVRQAEAALAAAQKVEAMIRGDRDLIAADLAAATSYPPSEPVYVEPVYVEPSIVVIDGGTSIYYPPSKDHHDHGRDWDRGGTRRDDGDRGTRRREDNEPRRPDRGNDDGRPDRPGDPDGKPPTPPPAQAKGEDAATARRKQEEAKAAERHRQEDAAAAASRKAAADRAEAAQAAAREARHRDESARADVENRRRQQDAEASARRQQQQQEQQRQRDSGSSSSGGSSSGSSGSSGGDRGSRYQRR